jgi:hypothetical protein
LFNPCPNARQLREKHAEDLLLEVGVMHRVMGQNLAVKDWNFWLAGFSLAIGFHEMALLTGASSPE